MGYTHYLSKIDGKDSLTKREQYIINECYRSLLLAIKIKGPDDLLYLSNHDDEFPNIHEQCFHEYSLSKDGDMILLSGTANFFFTKTVRKLYDPAIMLCYLLIDICTGKYKYSYDGSIVSTKLVLHNGLSNVFKEYIREELGGDIGNILSNYISILESIYTSYYKYLLGYEKWKPNASLVINPKPFKDNTSYVTIFNIGDKVLHSGGVSIIERILKHNRYKLKGVRSYKSFNEIKLFDYLDMLKYIEGDTGDTQVANTYLSVVELNSLNMEEISEVCDNINRKKSQFKISNGQICELNLLYK